MAQFSSLTVAYIVGGALTGDKSIMTRREFTIHVGLIVHSYRQGQLSFNGAGQDKKHDNGV